MKLAQKKEVCLCPPYTPTEGEAGRQGGREGWLVGWLGWLAGWMGDGSARFSECLFSSTLAFFVAGGSGAFVAAALQPLVELKGRSPHLSLSPPSALSLIVYGALRVRLQQQGKKKKKNSFCENV